MLSLNSWAWADLPPCLRVAVATAAAAADLTLVVVVVVDAAALCRTLPRALLVLAVLRADLVVVLLLVPEVAPPDLGLSLEASAVVRLLVLSLASVRSLAFSLLALPLALAAAAEASEEAVAAVADEADEEDERALVGGQCSSESNCSRCRPCLSVLFLPLPFPPSKRNQTHIQHQ